jgi:hypothetical protein
MVSHLSEKLSHLNSSYSVYELKTHRHIFHPLWRRKKCGISNNVDGTKDDYLRDSDADHASSADGESSGE